ncbi:ImuA family protein [Alsobacter soli]|uniref:ImuA family protein n=1 Tax=Alsobacter soli TaxID=2109933 RepID=UPI001AECD025|nr:hypothetical protein [Alsobacter soli]
MRAHGLTSLSPAPAAAREASPAAGLARAALHEFYAAAPADGPAVTGALLALARMAAPDSPILWVRHAFVDRETGALYPPGVAELGLDPGRLTLVRARDIPSALQAGLEGARCAALGAAVIELWGEAKALDLTASRRLALAARTSGTLVLMARVAANPQPSAAETRWRIEAAPSRALEANAPGDPSFSFTLLRHRGGLAPGEWRLEWSRDHARFADRVPDASPARTGPALPGAVVPFSADRPDPPGAAAPVRRAG